MPPSSSSPDSQRRRRPKSLARSDSSFLGTIKNIVTAPLSWFASTDDLDLSSGKRRRPITSSQGADDDDDAASPQLNKRMRVRSPSPPHMAATTPAPYLDPPVSAFHPKPARSVPYDLHHNNASLTRQDSLSRTMSIDPPARPLVSPSRPLRRDVSIERGSFMRSSARDLSLPPLSSHPSFRIRTSTTPQPHPYRDKSAPPPLSSLASNPTFIRAPPTTDSLHVAIPTQPSLNLGSLVNSTRSPIRRHSSLFEPNVEHSSISPRPISAIEKALYELDIYKTPLVPTRIRSSNTPAPPTSDLFRSRRTSQLVLMQEDKRSSRLGRKAKKTQDPVANETKPYAGQGGMKKLLARRKMEIEEHVQEERVRAHKSDDQNQSALECEDGMLDGRSKFDRDVEKPSRDANIPSRVPPFLSIDPFSSTSTSARDKGSSSSLRVGRTKTSRNHYARPAARPIRMKFSAAYDDDDAMDDGEEEAEREKEKEMLEEAAKHAPAFKVAEGFTFAKDVPPIQHDPTGSKEPPIPSLPFSFAKATPTTEAPPAILQPQPTTLTPSTSFAPPLTAPSSTVPQTGTTSITEPALPITVPEPTRPVSTGAPSPPPTNVNGVPNFFANSPVLAQSVAVPKTPPLVFSNSQSAVAQAVENSTVTAPLFAPGGPVKDTDNPLWEGELGKKEISTGPSILFGGFDPVGGTATTSESLVPAVVQAPVPPRSLFGVVEKKQEDVASAPPNFSRTSVGTTTSAPPPSFDGVPKPVGSFPAPNLTTSMLFSSNSSKVTNEPAAVPFSFGQPASSSVDSKKLTTSELFPSTQPSKIADPPTFSFSDSAKSTATASDTSKPPKPFFSGFSTPAEAPKALFSGTGAGGFSFGVNKESAQKSAGTPFSFGAAPSTPPPVDTKSSLFNFSATTSAPSALPSVGFSFSSGREAPSTDAAKPFAFGRPAAMVPTERPSTPPKNEEMNMDESPTRDAQEVAKLSERPTLGGGGFSFGANGSSSPFSFSTASSSSNPFVKISEPEESKPFGGFGQPSPAAASTAFGFGQPQDKESLRPSTAGSFSFGASASTGGSGFNFGAPAANATSGMFGSTSASSAPSSPSTFGNQASSPFTFAAPLPAFAFGSSQPASPAGGNVSLPAPTTPGGFGGSGVSFGQAPSASPFGTPGGGVSPAAPTNGALFTIGAPPAAAGPTSGSRPIRKLPTRRGGAKR